MLLLAALAVPVIVGGVVLFLMDTAARTLLRLVGQ
jgi:hypothetical protein